MYELSDLLHWFRPFDRLNFGTVIRSSTSDDHDHNLYVHRKKRFTSFPSPAGMSLTKLPLGRNNSVMTSLFPPRESLVVTSRLGTGNSRTFFYGVQGSSWQPVIHNSLHIHISHRTSTPADRKVALYPFILFFDHLCPFSSSALSIWSSFLVCRNGYFVMSAL